MDENSGKIARGIRYGFLLAMLIIQSCSAAVVETPMPTAEAPAIATSTVEQPSSPTPTSTPKEPVMATPTVEQPSSPTPMPTSATVEVTPSPATEPPAGFKQYQDSVVGVSVYIPESWVVTQVVSGQRAILQSFPETKYVGGEALKPGDTKCDLSIRPPDISVVDFVQQMKSNSAITIISEDEIILKSGKPGIRIELESMGRSLSLVTEVNERVVVLTCFGELALFDEIAVTLGASE
jgi:hypothetical protein